MLHIRHASPSSSKPEPRQRKQELLETRAWPAHRRTGATCSFSRGERRRRLPVDLEEEAGSALRGRACSWGLEASASCRSRPLCFRERWRGAPSTSRSRTCLSVNAPSWCGQCLLPSEIARQWLGLDDALRAAEGSLGRGKDSAKDLASAMASRGNGPYPAAPAPPPPDRSTEASVLPGVTSPPAGGGGIGIPGGLGGACGAPRMRGATAAAPPE